MKIPFQSIRPGDSVKYNAYAGMSLTGPEFKPRSAKAIIVNREGVIGKATSVVVCKGKGNPSVVDLSNFISATRRNKI